MTGCITIVVVVGCIETDNNSDMVGLLSHIYSPQQALSPGD